MASPIQLTATATLINGHGLASNSNLATQISTFYSKAHLVKLANIFVTANTAFSITDANVSANVAANVANIVANIGSGVTNGSQWLIDFYPSNISPITSGTVYNYWTGNGATAKTSGFSNTIQNQSNLAFAHGMQGFANVFQTVYSYAQSVFDTVASVNTLQNKSYSQMSIGCKGPADLSTGGIGNSAPVLANVISKWGTMYDIKNINGIADPYVFGQNLLNQRLGKYGQLSNQLSSAGLNINNLVQIPLSSTTTSHVPTTTDVSTSIGVVTLPVMAPVVTSTVVTGNSDKVVTGIYKSITGVDLKSIVTAANITANTSITTLSDYLDYTKVVDSASRSQLSTVGITSFATLSTYLQARIGQGRFNSWNDLASTLTQMSIPSLPTATTDPNAIVLSPTTISTLNNMTGTGTGPMNNPIPVDYLGTCVGVPYTSLFATLNTNYYTVANTIGLLANLTSLNTAISDYIVSLDTIPTTAMKTAVANINLALSSLSSSNSTVVSSRTAYYKLLNNLSTEVANLNRAGVVFNSGDAQTLNSFAQSCTSDAADSTQYYTNQFFANLITNDSYGDTIKAGIAESINDKVLQTKGIKSTSDPRPAQAISQAAAQNIPLSTYLSQNK